MSRARLGSAPAFDTVLTRFHPPRLLPITVGIVVGVVVVAILCYLLFRFVLQLGFPLERYTNHLLDLLGVMDGDTTVY